MTAQALNHANISAHLRLYLLESLYRTDTLSGDAFSPPLCSNLHLKRPPTHLVVGDTFTQCAIDEAFMPRWACTYHCQPMPRLLIAIMMLILSEFDCWFWPRRAAHVADVPSSSASSDSFGGDHFVSQGQRAGMSSADCEWGSSCHLIQAMVGAQMLWESMKSAL